MPMVPFLESTTGVSGDVESAMSVLVDLPTSQGIGSFVVGQRDRKEEL